MLCSTHPFAPRPVKSDQKRRPATVLVTKNLNPTLHEKEADRCQGAVGSVDRPPSSQPNAGCPTTRMYMLEQTKSHIATVIITLLDLTPIFVSKVPASHPPHRRFLLASRPQQWPLVMVVVGSTHAPGTVARNCRAGGTGYSLAAVSSRQVYPPSRLAPLSTPVGIDESRLVLELAAGVMAPAPR